jgi:uncharacterized protein YdeI (YjbR/CyaY-like superfamily)
MNAPDPRVDAYIAKSADFARPILARLRGYVRSICPQAEETVKWGAPSYTYRGKILCGMAAFKGHASFGFWQHAQVMGEDVERDGMGSFGRMASLRDVPSKKTIEPLLRKAMALIDEGVSSRSTRPKASRPAPEPSDEFAAALRRNTAARKAFEAFSPSHRREYVEWIDDAKRDETRARRITQAIAWLAEGKPRNWKYMDC